MANMGKVFEKDFFKSFPQHTNISIDRVYDTTSGFKGHRTFCDFIVYRYPSIFFFELKSYEGTAIPIKAISDNQFEGLLNKAYISGVQAGVILNYRIADSVEFAYYLDIKQILSLKSNGESIIPIEFAALQGTLLEGTKKRTRFTYNIPSFLDKILIDKKRRGL